MNLSADVGHKMKKTIVAVYAITCLFIAGCTTRTPRDMIENRLGVSPAAAQILDDALAHPQAAPDVGLLLQRLSELKQDRNLTLGIFLMEADPDLMVTNLMTSGNPAILFRTALSNNTTSAGATVVRPEDISNIVIETNQNGITIGTFDWSAPSLLKGSCRFVAKGNELEYLGFLRKNPTSTYDCQTIFSRHGNIFASHQWIKTEYFAVIEPTSEATTPFSHSNQIRSLQEILRPRGLSSFHWPIRDQALPLVYSGEREDRDKVITILKDSDDWNVTMSGRAVDYPFEEPLCKSIENQIRKLTNNPSRHTVDSRADTSATGW